MGRYDKDDKGFYPKLKPKNKLKERIDDTLYVISVAIERNIKEARIRVLMNDIFEYLERFKGFHYGISEGVSNLDRNKINSQHITLDHAVPSKVLIKELKLRKPKYPQDLLEFFKQHYFLCFITKEEDKRLNEKFKQSMPIGWNENWQDWEVRYRAVEINLSVKPGNV